MAEISTSATAANNKSAKKKNSFQIRPKNSKFDLKKSGKSDLKKLLDVLCPDDLPVLLELVEVAEEAVLHVVVLVDGLDLKNLQCTFGFLKFFQ